jgi:hypothetical protein
VETVLSDLIRNKGKTVTLTFDDGDMVDAELLDIDTMEHDDIVFKVVQVRRATNPALYSREGFLVASIPSVVKVESAG